MRRARVQEPGERTGKCRRSGQKAEQTLSTIISSVERGESTYGVVGFAGSRWLCLHGGCAGREVTHFSSSWSIGQTCTYSLPARGKTSRRAGGIRRSHQRVALYSSVKVGHERWNVVPTSHSRSSTRSCHTQYPAIRRGAFAKLGSRDLEINMCASTPVLAQV